MDKLIVSLLILLLIGCNTERKIKQTNPSASIDNRLAGMVSDAPIMGWASWNNYRVNINEDIIKSQADAMVASGLKEAGYAYINIDDGFFGGRDKNIPMQAAIPALPIGIRIPLEPEWDYMVTMSRT